MNTRFLISVLAFAAFGVSASASVVTYCSGSGCATENNAQFVSDLASDAYSLGALMTFTTSNGSLAGADYTDTGSGVLFADFLGHSLSFSGTAITTPVEATGVNYIEITIPSTITAIQLAVTAPEGICLDAHCPANMTTGFIGFINNAPTGPSWTVELGAFQNGSFLEINSFSVAGGSVSPTPEVGTMMLIGFGLISMRWMRRLPKLFFRTPQPA